MTKDLEHIIRQAVGTNMTAFTEGELTLEGIRHVKLLHRAIKCHDMIISKVLVYNESALNVCLTIPLGRI